MRTHPIGQPVMHRPDLEIDRLDASEGTLHQGEGFVAAHGRRVVERLGGQAGAYDIDAVGRRLRGDLGGLAGEAEGGAGDVEVEVLCHLVLVDHGTDRKCDLGGTAQRIALAGDGEDAVLEYPQSVKRIRGRRKIQSSRAAQPNRKRFTVRRIIGAGDLWVTEY